MFLTPEVGAHHGQSSELLHICVVFRDVYFSIDIISFIFSLPFHIRILDLAVFFFPESISSITVVDAGDQERQLIQIKVRLVRNYPLVFVEEEQVWVFVLLCYFFGCDEDVCSLLGVFHHITDHMMLRLLMQLRNVHIIKLRTTRQNHEEISRFIFDSLSLNFFPSFLFHRRVD
jgi:hypothetical protein